VVLPLLHKALTLQSLELDICNDFLGVCSSLDHMSSNFSVSTWYVCFCFLSIKSSVLSLFTKL
jgi:hypothetical protein